MAETILPEDPNAALQTMIDLAHECLALVQDEDEKITRNDMIDFAVTEQYKNAAFTKYEAAAAEFNVRAEELREAVNPNLITELQRVQLQLREQAESNNKRLEAIEGLIKKES